jgi:Tol biopolymer transport system component/DNA-binding winged helix-turn-helix (wHTH) protein
MPFTIRKDSGSSSPKAQKIAFDNFEVDLRSGEVRKNDNRIRLQAQPFQLLVLLLENAGEVVTRDEICRELWPANTFVDFERSLPAAVNKIRGALDDAAGEPRYIETLPKRGYRFIGKIKPEAPLLMTVAELQETGRLVAAPAAKWWRGRHSKFTVAGIAALVAALAVWLVLSRKLTNFKPNAQPMTAVPFTSYPGLETNPAISPDGSRIAFAWDPGSGDHSGAPAFDLYLKTVGSETLLRLTYHPSDWVSPAWSPDGTQIAFHRIAGPQTGIYLVPALGGPERKLLATRAPYDLAAPLSWSPDGKWIAYSDNAIGHPNNTNFLLNVKTLEVHELPHNPACVHEGNPTFSHSGRQLALLCVHSTANFEYFVADAEGKSSRSLVTVHEFPTSVAWTSDDQQLIISRARKMGPELDKLRVSDGFLEKLPIPVNGDWPSITPDGKKLAFTSSIFHSTIWRKDLLHPHAPPVQLYASTLQENEARYSPDGKRVAFDSARSGVWSVWMADVDGSNLVRLSHEGTAGFPQWSPDSQKIAFEVMEDDRSSAIFVADISDRVPRKLPIPFRLATSPSWSYDGKSIYFRTFEGVGQQIYRVPAGGGDPTLLVASDTINIPMESPDGKILYFAPRFAGAPLLMVPLDQPQATPRAVPGMPNISSEYQLTVVADGIFFAPLSAPRTICFFDFATGKTRELFKTDRDLSDGLSVSPGGRFLLFSQLDENNSNIMLVDNFH